MSTRHATLCAACQRLRKANGQGQPTCEAYPGGIPNQIVRWGGEHRTPRPGDHGLQFVLKEGQEEQYEDWLFANDPNELRRRRDGNQAAGG